MRLFIVLFALAALLGGRASVLADPPPELREVQGKYQHALESIARTYEGQVVDLNGKYVTALQKLRQQLEARGDEGGVRLVDAEIDWMRESRDQIPHPWELLEAGSERVIGTDAADVAGLPGFSPRPDVPGGTRATLALGPFWNRTTRTGATVQKELRDLFDDYAEPAVMLDGVAGLTICKGVTYLMPVDEAVGALDAVREGKERRLVETPGFPERSFYYHACTGNFEGSFDTALIVTDVDDQVVAVQFSGDAGTGDNASFFQDMSDEWKTHDLVRNSRKASSGWYVGHKITLHIRQDQGRHVWFEPYRSNKGDYRRITEDGEQEYMSAQDALRAVAAAPTAVLQIDTITSDGNPMYGSARYHDRSRLYLPRRIVSLILSRVSQ